MADGAGCGVGRGEFGGETDCVEIVGGEKAVQRSGQGADVDGRRRSRRRRLCRRQQVNRGQGGRHLGRKPLQRLGQVGGVGRQGILHRTRRLRKTRQSEIGGEAGEKMRQAMRLGGPAGWQGLGYPIRNFGLGPAEIRQQPGRQPRIPAQSLNKGGQVEHRRLGAGLSVHQRLPYLDDAPLPPSYTRRAERGTPGCGILVETVGARDFMRKALAIILATLTCLAAPESSAATLDEVRRRGAVRCGVTDLGQVLATINVEGRWEGFYTEFCRAIAAAVTGGADNADFVMVSVQDRFDAVRNGDVDLLAESSTWTFGRDTHGLTFAGIYFMDAQGFLVHSASGFRGLRDLKGRKVCSQANSTSVENVEEISTTLGLGMEIKGFGTIEGAYAAFFGRQCDALTTDSMVLTSMRQLMAPNPQDYVILPDRISKEPLGPVVREGDPRWADVVRWTLFAMIAAEELGITSANVDQQRQSGGAEARRLLGGVPGFGSRLGLADSWAYDLLSQVGNYGELFERSLGAKSPLKMERGLNDLWSRGGLLWAPPVR